MSFPGRGHIASGCSSNRRVEFIRGCSTRNHPPGWLDGEGRGPPGGFPENPAHPSHSGFPKEFADLSVTGSVTCNGLKCYMLPISSNRDVTAWHRGKNILRSGLRFIAARRGFWEWLDALRYESQRS